MALAAVNLNIMIETLPEEEPDLVRSLCLREQC